MGQKIKHRQQRKPKNFTRDGLYNPNSPPHRERKVKRPKNLPRHWEDSDV